MLAYSPPSQTGASTSLEHFSIFRFSSFLSDSLSTLALSQPLPSSPPWWYAIVTILLVVYSLGRSTYWMVKHRVRDTNWSFRWLWRLSSVSITEDWALFVRRTFIFPLNAYNFKAQRCSWWPLTVRQIGRIFAQKCFWDEKLKRSLCMRVPIMMRVVGRKTVGSLQKECQQNGDLGKNNSKKLGKPPGRANNIIKGLKWRLLNKVLPTSDRLSRQLKG